MAARKKPAEEPTFEESMEELETVVGKLEAGDVPLEQALAAFERRLLSGPAPFDRFVEGARLDPVYRPGVVLTGGGQGQAAFQLRHRCR